jgi:hypothetical protein
VNLPSSWHLLFFYSFFSSSSFSSSSLLSLFLLCFCLFHFLFFFFTAKQHRENWRRETAPVDADGGGIVLGWETTRAGVSLFFLSRSVRSLLHFLLCPHLSLLFFFCFSSDLFSFFLLFHLFHFSLFFSVFLLSHQSRERDGRQEGERYRGLWARLVAAAEHGGAALEARLGCSGVADLWCGLDGWARTVKNSSWRIDLEWLRRLVGSGLEHG